MQRVGGLAGLAGVLLLLGSCGGGQGVDAVQAQHSAAPLRAGVTLDAAGLFKWAPTHYGQFFAGGYAVRNFGPYTYRHYPLTNNDLAVANGIVYYRLGGDSAPIVAAGTLASFECQVYPTNCPVTTSPATDIGTLSGYYASSQSGTLPFAWTIFAADGSFLGGNRNDTNSDVFSGTAVAQPGTWSATNARYGTDNSSGPYMTLGSANFTGTFANAATASADVAVTGVPAVSSHLDMTYQAVSNTPASLWIGGGTYSAPGLGQAIQIDTSSGAVSGTAQTACAITGTLSVPEPLRNVYKLSASLSGDGCLVSGQVDFLGYYDGSTTQQVLQLYGTTPGSQMAVFHFQFWRPPA